MATDSRASRFQLRAAIIRAVLAVLLWTTHRRRCRPCRRLLPSDGVHVLLTGTFYSANWINSQLIPLCRAQKIAKVTFVSAIPVQDIDGLEVIYAPKLLQKVLGGVPARLLTFAWHGIRTRPDLIGGFHLLINGLVAQFVARLARTRSVHICVGGPTEVAGGGYATENRIFGRLNGPDERIERQLLSAISSFDVMVVRGNSAKEFYAQHGITTPQHIITAGVDSEVFSPTQSDREFDIAFLARLSDVKRIEIFLTVVRKLKADFDTSINALIIGDGPLRATAENYVAVNELTENVCFVGQVDDVATQLNRAKTYALTSRSEGLSQAMVQAMLCGLPPVVANVGSLADLITNGVSGYLVDDHGNADAYIPPFVALLSETDRCREMSGAARASAMQCSVDAVAKKWDVLVTSLVITERT